MNYLIHDNGDRPFMVEIEGNNASIYRKEYSKDTDEIKSYNQLIRSYVCDEIFIGQDLTEDKYFEGNSILLKLRNTKNIENTYVFIGSIIYEFTCDEEIKQYKSPVGNSDVPYPYAIGTENVYLLVEDVIIPLTPEYIDAVNGDDPYDLYYSDRKKMKEYKYIKQKLIYGRIW